MSKEIITGRTSKATLDLARSVDQAAIYEGNTQRPSAIQVLELDVSTPVLESNPYKISFPFKAVFIRKATYLGVDNSINTEVFLKPNSNDSFQGAIPLKLNDVLEFERPVSEAFLYWNNGSVFGSGTTMTLIFFVDASFRSGSTISKELVSTTYVSDTIPLSAATEGILVPSSLALVTSTLQNKTGADLYIGEQGSVLADGLVIPDGAFVKVTGKGNLYGYSVAGGNVKRLSEF